MKSALAALLSLGLLSVVFGGGRTALMVHASTSVVDLR
jgi:hypothetical protein